MKRVLVESPFSGNGCAETERENIEYAQRCLHDCFERDEAPFASHLLYTQQHVLDDEIPDERQLGIAAGLLWGECADKSVFYVDRGVSRGMLYGLKAAVSAGRPVEIRAIDGKYRFVPVPVEWYEIVPDGYNVKYDL